MNELDPGAMTNFKQLLAILWADASPWTMAIEQALQERLPRLKALAQAKDVLARREELMTLYDANQGTLSDLLNLARQDSDLAIRRAARQAMRAEQPSLPH